MLRQSLRFALPLVLMAAFVQADDAPPKTKLNLTPAAKAKAAEGKAADPFAVPEGNDTKVLMMFLQGLGRVEPAAQTPEALLEHFNKIDAAVVEVLSRDIESQLKLGVVQMRTQVFGLLARFGATDVEERAQAMLAKLEEDERPEIQNFVKNQKFGRRINESLEGTPEERSAIVQEIGLMLQSVKQGDDEALQTCLQFAQGMAQALEQAELNEEAVVAYRHFAKMTASLKDERLDGMVEAFEATARRLGLMGHPIEIVGTTLGGEKFDIKDWKGKVVLVDFWATWCGPCMQELPNVKAMYEAYHEKGFEVVGISLDEDRETLEKFLGSEKINWTTLFPEDPDSLGWENPIARMYGISGIPAVILVNQEGNVIHMNARGPLLEAELEKLLGPVEKQPASPKKSAADNM